METKPTLSQLLAKPIWQMTGEEFLQLNELGRENAAAGEEPKEVIEYAHGITELSQKIGCCQSTIYMLKKEGVLDDAIVSQVGQDHLQRWQGQSPGRRVSEDAEGNPA